MTPNVAIILARQNSKGIALKNLQKVGGVTLLERAIQSAINSRIFSHIVVSTDGDEMIKVAKQYRDVLIVKRPDVLANDSATSIDGVLHALEVLLIDEGVCCLLQPTSPLRQAWHIKQAYQLFVEQACVGSVIAAKKANQHPYKTLVLSDDKYQAVHLLSDLEAPRQSLPQAFCPNGAIYFNQIATLKQNRRFFNEPITLYPMSDKHSLDIDTPEDLVLANHYLMQDA